MQQNQTKAPSLVKLGQSQTLKRIYKVLSEFHLHVQVVQLVDGGHVLAQLSGVDAAWTFAYFDRQLPIRDKKCIVYVHECQPRVYRRGAVSIYQMAPFLDQNYRTCQNYEVHFFHSESEALICTRAPTNATTTTKFDDGATSLLGECRVERLSSNDQIVLDEAILPNNIKTAADFARWRHECLPSYDVCVLETNKDIWDSACKSLSKACAYVDVSFDKVKFWLEGVMTEDVTQPRVLRYGVPTSWARGAKAPAMFKRTPDTKDVYCNPNRKVRLAVRALHRAIHHQGPVRERHSRLLVQWLPCEGRVSESSVSLQLTNCHLILSTLYDGGRNGLSVALKDVSSSSRKRGA